MLLLFYHYLNRSGFFLDCGTPPVVENAEAFHSLNSPVGDKVFYACLEGYTRLSGDSYLTCTTSENLVHSWTGSIMKCNEDSKLKVNQVIIKTKSASL